jgi:hypothetical protein
MSEPVAVPISTSDLQEAIATSSPPAPHDRDVILSDSTMNHLSYKASNGVPYVIDYFGIKEFYNTNPQITEMARELHELLVDNDNEVTVEQTKQLLDLFSQELNLQENDAPIYKLRKSLFLAKTKNRIADIEKKKMQILANIA